MQYDSAIKYQRLTIIVFSLFFAWLLAFPFEGRILYALAGYYNVPVHQFVFSTLAAHFAGLILCGFLIKSIKAAKRLTLGSIALCAAASGVFFLPPSFLWTAALLTTSLMAGCSVAAWGFFLKSGTPKKARIKTIACGVYDLFWWSILGEMLELHKNPARVLGVGLSANVLGVLLGGLIGNALFSADMKSQNSTLPALGVVCVTLVMLPPLNKRLTALLENHAYLTVLFEMPHQEQTRLIRDFSISEKLTERESEIASLLFTGKTYRMIAGELRVSENTVKTHVRNL